MYYYLALLFSLVYLINGDVIVETDLGKVEGLEVKSILENEKFYSFMGIPYALPPVGDLRFMPPQPHTGWEEVLDVKKEPQHCAQFNHPSRPLKHYGFCGVEDCLKLSIHTPNPSVDENSQMPVMVFLYNELFRVSHNASRDYGPDFFMSEDVVIVFIHHRINSLGFLSFEDDLLPGNNGLRDIILALKWLNKNIQVFGGDPNRITLMGNSGGAVTVDLLLHSPKAKGLFHRAILQSGTSWSSHYLGKKSRQRARMLSKELERESSTSSTLIKKLADISAMQITGVEHLTIGADEGREEQRGFFPFSPVIEHEHPDAIITQYPEHKRIEIDIPVMIGYNSRESIESAARFLSKPQYLTFADRDFMFTFPLRVNFKFDIHSTVYKNAMKEIKDFYFDEGYIKISKQAEFFNYINDLMHIYHVDYTVRRYANESTFPVYYYTFDYSGELNMRKKNILRDALKLDGTWGASVGDELCYLFICKPIRKAYKAALKEESSEELKVLKNMVRLWTNFAKFGNPTPPGSDLTWSPATPEKKECLVISDEVQMGTNLHQEQIDFWDQFLAKYGAMADNGIIKDKKDEL